MAIKTLMISADNFEDLELLVPYYRLKEAGVEVDVAAICHGPQALISAGLMKGKRVTCYKSVAPELKAAGALYEDKGVVVDGNPVTSRHRPIFPPSCAKP